MKKIIFFTAILSLAGGIFAQNFNSIASKQNISSFDINLPDLAGEVHSFSDWQGKVLIINFWATWCPPCLKEIPDFIKVQDTYKNNDLQFIGIAIEDKEDVKEYLSTININYPILIGGDNAIALSHKLGNIINAVPFTVIINKQGYIVHQHPGELSQEKILEIITPLI